MAKRREATNQREGEREKKAVRGRRSRCGGAFRTVEWGVWWRGPAGHSDPERVQDYGRKVALGGVREAERPQAGTDGVHVPKQGPVPAQLRHHLDDQGWHEVRDEGHRPGE